MVGEAGGRGGKASESTHLSFFCLHRIAVLFFGDTFTFSNGTSLCFSFYSQYWLDKGPREIRNCCLCKISHYNKLVTCDTKVGLLSRILKSVIKVGYSSRFKSFYPIFYR